MSERDELMACAILGDEAKRFTESELGRLILGLARQEVEAAKQELLKVKPEDTERIRELQAQALFGVRFEDWLIGIMNDGEQSLAAFRQQQQEG